MKRTRIQLCVIVWVLVLSAVLTACGPENLAPSVTQSGPSWQEQYDLGLRYLSDGNYEAAILAFTAAIEIDPNRPEAYIGRGDAYIASGETAENLAAALADYQAALTLDETLADAWLGIADVYIRQEKYDLALENLKEALEKTEHNDKIVSKIEEIEGGEDLDSSGTVRRSRVYRDGILSSMSIYDAEGRITYSEIYDEDGSINNYNKFEYSADGLTRKQLAYLPDDTLWTIHIYTYGSNGNLERSDLFDVEDGDPNRYRYHCYNIYTYDEQGQQIKSTRYEDDGELRFYIDYEYNSDGTLSRSTQFSADGTIEEYSIYSYDSSGNCTTEIHTQDGSVHIYTESE